MLGYDSRPYLGRYREHFAYAPAAANCGVHDDGRSMLGGVMVPEKLNLVSPNIHGLLI